VDQQQLPNEAGLRPWPGEKVRVAGRELIWKPCRVDDYWIDFNRFLGKETEDATAYAVCYLMAPATLRHLQVGIGSDDQAKIYLDGHMLLDSRDWRSIGLDQDLVPDITLTRGRHRFVFKVVNEIGDWSGCLRFLDQRALPVRSLQVSLTP
jgi:hypothetical protein